jgi:hypothetical protein
MTAISKTSATNNGWNAAVKALEECVDDEARKIRAANLLIKVDEVQGKFNSGNAIFHYAEGTREAIVEWETTGEIPSEA